MDNIHDNYWMESVGPAPGCGFFLLHAGKLAVHDGTFYRFGGYFCWHVVSAGLGFVRCGSHRYSLKPGDLFSVVPSRRIEYGSADGKPFEFIYLRLEGKEASAMFKRIGLTEEAPVRTGCGTGLVELFRDVWLLAKNNCRLPEEYACRILKIMSYLNSDGISRRRTAAGLVQEALRLIENPVERDYNVNELAESLHVSRVTLFNAFRQITGKPPKESIEHYRRNKYRELIERNPELGIAQLAGLAGFRDKQSFIRFFRRTVGMTPGEYRRSAGHCGFSSDPG